MLLPSVRWRLRRRVLLAFLAVLAPMSMVGVAAPASADVCRSWVNGVEQWTPYYPCPGPQDQPVAAAGVVVMSPFFGECCWAPVQYWKIEQGTQAYFANMDPWAPRDSDGSRRRFIEEGNIVGARVLADTGWVPLGGTVKFNGIESLKPGNYSIIAEDGYVESELVVTPCWTCQLTSDNTAA